MNIEEFTVKYKANKDIDIIEIQCDHPECKNPNKSIKKVSAKRNIMKKGQFVCRECFMTHENPLFVKNEVKRQTNEIINVICPECKSSREMKQNCYFGKMEKPYEQVCKSCAQKGKEISEEQRDKISQSLTGRELTQDHRDNISKYWKEHPDCISRENLIPGIGGGWNSGLKTPQEVRDKQSKSNLGIKKTEEHCENISKGRKEMLKEQGGLLPETKAKISQAVVRQYQNGFEPQTYHRRGRHITKTGDDIPYRSSYEKKAFLMLDEDDTVLKYDYEPFPIVYRKPDDDHDSNYLIDLLVWYKDGSKKLVEVKPVWRLNKPTVLAKIEAAKNIAIKLGMTYETWTEIELFDGSEQLAKEFCESLD